MEPAADRWAEQARDVAPGQEPADDRQSELEPADRWVEQTLRRRAECLRVDDQVPEPRADDRPGHDPDGHEGDVVGSQPAGTGEQTGQDQRRHDDPDERDRTPAHGQVAEQLDVGVEIEGHDGDRHGGDECIQGRRPDRHPAARARERPRRHASRSEPTTAYCRHGQWRAHPPIISPDADHATTRGSRSDATLPKYHRTMLIARISVLAAVWLVSACSAAAPSGDQSPSLAPSSAQPTRLPDPRRRAPRGPSTSRSRSSIRSSRRRPGSPASLSTRW